METEDTIRILLIKDKPGDVLLIKEMLSESGSQSIDLVHAESLASGLARLSSDPSFDCILLGLHLPDAHGLDLYEKVREHAPATAIVALTGQADDQILLPLLREGLQDYLCKDEITGELLLRAIRYAKDRIRATSEVISSEQRFRKCMNNLTDAVIVVNNDGDIQFLNPAAEHLFRKNSEVLLGSQFGFPITSDENMEIELFAWTKNPIIAEMRVTEIEWEGKPSSLASIRDITERKQMENVLTQTANDLKQSMMELEAANKKILESQKSIIEEERLKVLLQMAGATAHQLNQPLAAMLGNIELLNDPGNTPEEVKDFINEIDVAGKRIADIVKKMEEIRHYETTPYPGCDGIINFDQKIKLLSVEDSDVDFEAIRAVLDDVNQFFWTRAVNLEEALEKINQEKFDLVFLDYILPDGSAFDFLKTIHENGITIPVVVITGQGDETIASQIIRQGACDYLPKNKVTKEILSRIIKNTIEKTHLEKEVNQVQDRLAEMATKDELTGLYNRRFFLDVLKNEVARDKRYAHGLALVMMDLDHFKQINDTYGHVAGDTVLREFGRILTESLRESDIVCRYGGDEFVVIMPHTQSEDAWRICERTRKKVAAYPFEYNGTSFQAMISTGVVEYAKDADQSSDDLIKKADAAMYQAKKDGRNRVNAIGH